MLGNDVVDYSIDERKYLSKRFVNRILSLTEIEYLTQSNKQNAFLWSLWAAKEASFKAYQKTALLTIFSPIKFETEVNTLQALLKHDFKQPIQAKISFQGQVIHLKFSWPNPTTVHCVAFMGSSPKAELIQCSITNQWEADIESNQSSQVRSVAQKLLMQNKITAHIKRPMINMPGYIKPGPPVLFNHDNQQLPHEISLSHDGQWLAVSLLCR